MFLACCRTVNIGGLDNVHAASRGLYTATCQVIVLYLTNVFVVLGTADTRRAVGELQRNGRAFLVLLPLLGDDVLLIGHQLVTDDTSTFVRWQPLSLHALKFASGNRSVSRLVTARFVIRYTIGRKARLERTVAERRDVVDTATLHIEFLTYSPDGI